MSSTVTRAPASLAERRADLTERLILDAAVRILERGSIGEVTARAVAKEGGLSERTVFRYFATRDEFLDAIAAAVRARLDLPQPPESIEELVALPANLYARFEEQKSLTLAALHTELFDRLRETQAKERWLAVRKLVDAYARRAPERQRRIASANIRFFLAATAWHYYRFYFGFSLEDAVSCAETAIRQSLAGLRTAK